MSDPVRVLRLMNVCAAAKTYLEYIQSNEVQLCEDDPDELFDLAAAVERLEAGDVEDGEEDVEEGENAVAAAAEEAATEVRDRIKRRLMWLCIAGGLFSPGASGAAFYRGGAFGVGLGITFVMLTLFSGLMLIATVAFGDDI